MPKLNLDLFGASQKHQQEELGVDMSHVCTLVHRPKTLGLSEQSIVM